MKNFFYKCFIVLIIFNIISANAQVPTDSLVGYWSLNGNANDLSGNGNHGTIHGTTTAFIPTTCDSAIQLNNINFTSWYDINDYVSFPNYTLNNNFSVVLNFRFNFNVGYANHTCYIFSIGDHTCNTGFLGLSIESDCRIYPYFCSNDGINSYHNFADTIQPYQWYNLICTVEDTILNFYIDGQISDTLHIGAIHNFSNFPSFLGLHRWYCNNAGSSRYNGVIDEVYLYKKALSTSEINQMYLHYLNQNAFLIDSISIQYPNCIDSNSGSFEVNVNPYNGIYNYSIDSGQTYQTSNQFANLTYNSYLLNIHNYCHEFDTVITIDPTNQLLSQQDIYDSICSGSSYSLPNGTLVSQEGDYLDTIHSIIGCDSIIINTHLTVNEEEETDILADTSFCFGSELVLSIDPSYTFVLWSNGDTSNITTITIENQFWVLLVDSNGCNIIDTFQVYTNPLPIIEFSPEFPKICKGDTILISATSNITPSQMDWNNGEQSSAIQVSPYMNTVYSVICSTEYCIDSSSILVEVYDVPIVNLGFNDYICNNERVILDASYSNSTYLWSNNSTSSTLEVYEPGIYWVEVQNGICSSNDTIKFKPCSTIWVPNVFTPNNDGINDTFYPIITEIEDIQIYIYNRWGNKIFHSADFTTGWDGKYCGSELPGGNYYWLIIYTEHSSLNRKIERQIHGTVTLLR